MTISVQLPPHVEASFVAQARAKGVTLDEFVRAYLIEHAKQQSGERQNLSPEELDAVLDDIADMIPTNRPPLSDQALRRESIYSSDDER